MLRVIITWCCTLQKNTIPRAKKRIILARHKPTDLTHLVEWRRSPKVEVSPVSGGCDCVAEIKEKALLIHAKGKSEDTGGDCFAQ